MSWWYMLHMADDPMPGTGDDGDGDGDGGNDD